MNNKEIRRIIFENNLKKYEIAEAIGITQSTLSHWLQFELSPSRREKVLDAINKLIKQV